MIEPQPGFDAWQPIEEIDTWEGGLFWFGNNATGNVCAFGYGSDPDGDGFFVIGCDERFEFECIKRAWTHFILQRAPEISATDIAWNAAHRPPSAVET